MDITAINSANNFAKSVQPADVSQTEHGFSDLLQEAVSSVNDLQQKAESTARDFVVGDANSIHNTILSLEKADLSLRLLNQTRNKVVEAYQEVMRMQI